MKAIQSAVFAALSGYSGLSSLVGARIYPDVAPQDAIAPRVVWQEVSELQANDLGGSVETSGLNRYRIQVTSWAKGAERGATKSREVDSQVRLAMNAASGFKTLLLDSRALDYEPETSLHGYQSDFAVWIRT